MALPLLQTARRKPSVSAKALTACLAFFFGLEGEVVVDVVEVGRVVDEEAKFAHQFLREEVDGHFFAAQLQRLVRSCLFPRRAAELPEVDVVAVACDGKGRVERNVLRLNVDDLVVHGRTYAVCQDEQVSAVTDLSRDKTEGTTCSYV